jgi:hypothetical protein
LRNTAVALACFKKIFDEVIALGDLPGGEGIDKVVGQPVSMATAFRYGEVMPSVISLAVL